jgi:hypothetical protein
MHISDECKKIQEENRMQKMKIRARGTLKVVGAEPEESVQVFMTLQRLFRRMNLCLRYEGDETVHSSGFLAFGLHEVNGSFVWVPDETEGKEPPLESVLRSMDRLWDSKSALEAVERGFDSYRFHIYVEFDEYLEGSGCLYSELMCASRTDDTPAEELRFFEMNGFEYDGDETDIHELQFDMSERESLREWLHHMNGASDRREDALIDAVFDSDEAYGRFLKDWKVRKIPSADESDAGMQGFYPNALEPEIREKRCAIWKIYIMEEEQ